MKLNQFIILVMKFCNNGSEHKNIFQKIHSKRPVDPIAHLKSIFQYEHIYIWLWKTK